MGQNIVECGDKQLIVEDFFERVSILLKDCDDSEEKEKIKEILRNLNNTISYIIVGENAVGKTTLLKELFRDTIQIDEEMAADICEYRYGEQNFTAPPSNGFQKKFFASEKLRGISIIDTKGINQIAEVSQKKIAELILKCEAIFVVLDVQHINSTRLWDMIEEFKKKKMVFFLTKCDLISPGEVKARIDKVKCYLREADISAEVFPICTIEDRVVEEAASIQEVCRYIKKELIGENPVVMRQWDNIQETGKLLAEMKKSFELRQEQYRSDTLVLQNINKELDKYVMNREKVVSKLLEEISQDINREIDAYETEIISKMDPYKIKERFPAQQDFSNYLEMVNDNYRNILNDSVNRRAIGGIKECLHELEMVFERAVGFFDERETILALNDKFYGSLSTSRNNMIGEVKKNTYAIGNYCKSLYDASEALFMQVWEERKKYDNRNRIKNELSIGGGASVGAAAAVKAAALAGISLGTAGTIVMVAAVGGFLGAVAIKKIADTLYAPQSANRMEKAVKQCVEQFRQEVGRIRVEMTEQVSRQVKDIFSQELASADGYFTEFRMSVNIDERRLPLIETKLEETYRLLKAIEA